MQNRVGRQGLCQHNFEHNRYEQESGIMLAFSGDNQIKQITQFYKKD